MKEGAHVSDKLGSVFYQPNPIVLVLESWNLELYLFSRPETPKPTEINFDTQSPLAVSPAMTSAKDALRFLWWAIGRKNPRDEFVEADATIAIPQDFFASKKSLEVLGEVFGRESSSWVGVRDGLIRSWCDANFAFCEYGLEVQNTQIWWIFRFVLWHVGIPNL